MQARHGARGFTLIEVMVALGILALVAVLSWRGLDAMSRVRQSTSQTSTHMLTLQTALAQWRTDLDAALPDAGAAPDKAGATTSASTLDWDGNTLRVLRRASNATALPTGEAAGEGGGMLAPTPGTQVVAWTLRTPCPSAMTNDSPTASNPPACWQRWQSPVLQSTGEQQAAWQQAGVWGAQGSSGGNSMAQTVLAAQQWQVYYFRENAWVHPQSGVAVASQTGSGAAGGSGTTGEGGAGAPASAAQRMPDAVRLVLTLAGDGALQGDLTVDWLSPTLTRQRS